MTAGSCTGGLGPEGCPTPGAHLAELVEVTALIAHVYDIHTLDVRAGVDHLDLEDDVVAMLTVDVVAARSPDAARLARMLHLTERAGHHGSEPHGRTTWRCWTGWVPAAGPGLPVSLHVTAPIRG
ncbi:hypothetical protein GCM10010413_52140 [Promicromonospora sukumoe]|uniref:Uncharacterized protein n=1 Tax=Promicromonospora sukumoe TaxID=88382 RepID=A0A7W3PGI9_9MICO|nr:hypothetical protein [Promicromonospora sukumoe]MBA8810659.1 hypothetical protein [Promicromonospora sukumoe]